MILPIHSQTISRGEIQEIVNSNGDTLVIMHLEDARIILNDLLEYEVTDSLLTAYKEKDSLNTNAISKIWNLGRGAFEIPIEVMLQAEGDPTKY